LLFDWQEFAHHYFAKMETTGVVKSMKDFYWDIRPKPEYGTIELRVCDTPLTVDRAAALAAYLQALCRMLLQRDEAPPVEDDYLVYNYNRFQACRFGLDGVLVHPKNHASRLLREDVLATLAKLEPHAAALDSLTALEQLRHEVTSEGNHASFLRQRFVDAGSVQGVVDAAVTLFRRGRSR
jgi:carboxylate-amine ligase